MDECQEALWGSAGIKVLKYLHSLGLSDETLRIFRIGHNPSDRFEPAAQWGLVTSTEGRPSSIRLPRGIVIPCLVSGQLWNLKILLPVANQKSSAAQYTLLKGSKVGVFGADSVASMPAAVLAGSEIDAMLLHQAAPDLAGSAFLGKHITRMGAADFAIWGRYLLSSAVILLVDYEQTTDYGWLQTVASFSCRLRMARVPEAITGQPLTAMVQANLDIRQWLSQELEIVKRPLSTLALVKPADVTQRPELRPTSIAVPATTVQSVPIADAIQHSSGMPTTPCYACHQVRYWQRQDGGWVCGVCHPEPSSLVSAARLGQHYISETGLHLVDAAPREPAEAERRKPHPVPRRDHGDLNDVVAHPSRNYPYGLQ